MVSSNIVTSPRFGGVYRMEIINKDSAYANASAYVEEMDNLPEEQLIKALEKLEQDCFNNLKTTLDRHNLNPREITLGVSGDDFTQFVIANDKNGESATPILELDKQISALISRISQPGKVPENVMHQLTKLEAQKQKLTDEIVKNPNGTLFVNGREHKLVLNA